jgi:hypothetical protein
MFRFLAAKIILLCFAAVFHSQCLAEWTPPAKPDPHKILQEAQEDYRARRNEVALEKFFWFHHNALAIDDGLRGVRLSFALLDWKKLADAYPPAMAAYVDTRNRAEGQLAGATGANPLPFQAFVDAIAMNDYLEAHQRNVALYKNLAPLYPLEAKRVYVRAERSLIKTQSYALCNPYLDPPGDYAKHLTRYREDVARIKAKPSKRSEDDDYPARYFGDNIANLVALLVRNNRSAEAMDVANKAKAEVKNTGVHATINAALKGEFPVSVSNEGAIATLTRLLDRLLRF